MPSLKRKPSNAGFKSNKRQRKTRARAVTTGVHKHVKFYATSYTGSAANPMQLSAGITPSNLGGFSELVSLYDQYRIDRAELVLTLRTSPDAQAATGASYPKVYWSRSPDLLGPLSMAQIRERSNMKMAVLDPSNPVRIQWKPNVLNHIYRQGAAAVGLVPVFGQWIDTATADVQHFGINYNITDFTNTNMVVDVDLKVTISCKGSI